MSSNDPNNTYAYAYPATGSGEDQFNSCGLYTPFNTSVQKSGPELDLYVQSLLSAPWGSHMSFNTNSFSPSEYQSTSQDPHFYMTDLESTIMPRFTPEQWQQFWQILGSISPPIEADAHGFDALLANLQYTPSEVAMSVPTALPDAAAPATVQGTITPAASLSPVVCAPSPSIVMVRFAPIVFCTTSRPDRPFHRFSRKSPFRPRSRSFLLATSAPPSLSATR